MTLETIENERCCGKCRFYHEGDCRRFPPQVGCDSNSEYSSGVFYAFPSVRKEEWCGEFKPNEEWVLPKGWELKNMPVGPGGFCEIKNNS